METEETQFFLDGEELGALVGQAIGAPVADIHRTADGVWIEYLDGAPAALDGSQAQAGNPESEVLLGLLDAMIGNHDRQAIVVAGRGLVGYHHGSAWLDVEIGDTSPLPTPAARPDAAVHRRRQGGLPR